MTSRPLAIALLFALVALALGACSDSAGDGDQPPDRTDVAERDIAENDVTLPEDTGTPQDVDDEDAADEDAPDEDATGEDAPDEDATDDADAEDGADVEEDAPFCTPGLRECVDDANYRRCNTEGSAWGDAEPCGEGNYCESGRCLDSACLPNVMFAIDGSSSMVGEWDAIRGSIATVTANNPRVAYGLSMFPVRLGCSIGDGDEGPFGQPAVSWPHVPITPNATDTIDAWFEDNDAANGATPLVETLEWFAANATAIWGDLLENGYLVVMTEGDDRCDCDPDEPECLPASLGPPTAALLELGIRTYVIGYNIEVAPEALNAIASNGGTDISEFIAAGDEATLTDAFQIVIDDAKLCD